MLQDQAIVDRLSGDTALAALLGIYSGDPCVFADPQVPEDAPRPYVWLPQPSADSGWDGKIHRGRDVSRDIWCTTDNLGSWAPAQAIAARVREPLSASTSVEDYSGIIAEVFGPVVQESDESLCVLRLTLTHKHVS
jgi:hypothetical protein